MALDNMNDGVGKKIVEALKIQSGEADKFETESFEPAESISLEQNEEISLDAHVENPEPIKEEEEEHLPEDVDIAFNQSLAQNLSTSFMASNPDDIEYPANVRVLRQLITKLPAGVSKQTGAVIIRQTMEALGISMNSVLKEATEVQEMLLNNAKECKNNIAECKKQITYLEQKTQQYQKQATLMNDVISLFIQTGR